MFSSLKRHVFGALIAGSIGTLLWWVGFYWFAWPELSHSNNVSLETVVAWLSDTVQGACLVGGTFLVFAGARQRIHSRSISNGQGSVSANLLILGMLGVVVGILAPGCIYWGAMSLLPKGIYHLDQVEVWRLR